jgi:hypothetical protein
VVSLCDIFVHICNRRLDGNQFNGTINTQIGLLTKLRNLYFTLRNQLHFDLFFCLFAFCFLLALRRPIAFLAHCRVNWVVSRQSLHCATFFYFWSRWYWSTYLWTCRCRISSGFNNNLFVGSIPSELGRLTDMTELCDDHSMFNSSISSFVFYSSLLQNNDLTGKLPSTLSSLTRLDRL